MRLLETSTLKLYTFHEPNIPEYAILSHRWFGDEEEVTFQELQSLNDTLPCPFGRDARGQRVRRKKGYDKIASFCQLAEEDGFQYAWIDTCCIDKSNSTELSETINSMYKWYRSSRVCYVYLVDVPRVSYSNEKPLMLFKASEWFRRGWTLQELLAPQQHKYLAQDWSLIGVTVRNPISDKDVRLNRDACRCSTAFPGSKSLETEVSEASGIRIDCLRNFDPRWTRYTAVCVAERMSWAAKRETSRLEDTAYCLLGIFDIHMTLIYGEGEKAFIRLQEEIIRHSVDKTILAWDRVGHESVDQLLAPSPQYFKFVDFKFRNRPAPADEVHEITSQGLLTHMEVAAHPTSEDTLLACLDDSHSIFSSEMPEHQILLVLPIVTHISPFYSWSTWMSTRLGETHVYCPRELVAANPVAVKSRPRSFKRRKLRIARWHVDHWRTDHEDVIALKLALRLRIASLLLVHASGLFNLLVQAEFDVYAKVMCIYLSVVSLIWMSVRFRTIDRMNKLNVLEAQNLSRYTGYADKLIATQFLLAEVIVESRFWMWYAKEVSSGRVRFDEWLCLTRKGLSAIVWLACFRKMWGGQTLKGVKITSFNREQ